MIPNFSLAGVAFLFMLSCFNVSAQTDVLCQNGGTLATASDDFIIFNLNPAAPSVNYVAPYTYMITATQGGSPVAVTLSDGSAATSVPYGIVSPFRTASGTAGGGNITLTVTPNFGPNPVPVVYTLADPGACVTSGTCSAGQGKTVTYRYRSPMGVTDAEKWQAHIPKFNSTSEKVLTNVNVTMTAATVNSFFVENSATTASKGKFGVSSEAVFEFDGSPVLLDQNLGDIASASISLPAGRSVPATGSWGGDYSWNGNPPLSTLNRMMKDGWFNDPAYAYLNPTTDPRWVTNATGNAEDDDDIFMKLGTTKSVTNSASYNSADLIPFNGPSGEIPLTYSTFSGNSVSGGGGNLISSSKTQTYFEVEVTYTYNETCETTLPVKLESFKAERADNGVRLVWKVAEETNFDRYEIEHSTNAKSFVKIGTIAGTQLKAYSFVHEDPVAGLNYYRLKSVDLDATFALSTIVNARVEGTRSQNIYPNPVRVSESLHIPSAAIGKVASVEIVNLTGRVTRTFPKFEVENGLSISSLKSGLYLVRVYRTDGLVNVTKLVVTE